MTSLEVQLRSLAEPQTSLYVDTKKRASFLFDPKDAAEHDRETIYAIGTTGLEELIQMNRRFTQFQETLFSEEWKTLERAVETKQFNVKLDKKIDEFLVLLSPYFLLRPAHKAMEWLIRRYHIEQFNVDSLMRCILPYHETRLFTRAVQMIELEKSLKWKHWSFLAHIQIPGIPLPKASLINRCNIDATIARFICDMVIIFEEVHGEQTTATRAVMGLWVSTMIGCIQRQEKGGGSLENFVVTLLPFIKSGIESGSRDRVAGTLMILAQLARRFPLEEAFLSDIILLISKNVRGGNETHGVTCLLLICHHQPVDALHKKSILHLIKCPGLNDILESLKANGHDVLPLLRPLVKGLMGLALTDAANDSNKKFGILKGLILVETENTAFSAEIVDWFFSSFAEVYGSITVDNQQSPKTLLDVSCEMLKRFKQRYPDEVDEAVQRHLYGSNEDAIRTLTEKQALGAQHEPAVVQGQSLFLALNDASTQTRLLAAQELVREIKSGKALDQTFVTSSLRARLRDDSPEVVLALISGLGSRLTSVLPMQETKTILLQRLYDDGKLKRWSLVNEATVMLFLGKLSNTIGQADCVDIVARLMVPSRKASVPLGVSVVKALQKSAIPVLNQLTSEPVLSKRLKEEGLTKEEFLSAVTEAMFSAAAKNADAVQILVEEGSSELEILLGEKISVSFVSRYLKQLVQYLPPLQQLEEYCGWEKKVNGEKMDLLERVFSIVAHNASRDWSAELVDEFRQHFLTFLKVQFVSLRSALHFLSVIWIRFFTTSESVAPSGTDVVHAHALCVAHHFVAMATEHTNQLTWLLKSDSRVLHTLLISMCSPNLTIRRLIFKNLSIALTKAKELKKKGGNLEDSVAFLDYLVENESEICTDIGIIYPIVASWNFSKRSRAVFLEEIIKNVESYPVHVVCGILVFFANVTTVSLFKMCVKLLRSLDLTSSTASTNQKVGGADVIKSSTNQRAEKADVTDSPTNRQAPLDVVSSRVLRLCLAKYTNVSLTEDTPYLDNVESAVDTLFDALRCTRQCLPLNESVALAALRLIDEEFLKRMTLASRLQLVDLLVGLSFSLPEPEHSQVLNALRNVCCEGAVLIEDLTVVKAMAGIKTIREAKKHRASESQGKDPLSAENLRRTIVMLETLQSIEPEKISDHVKVVSTLFGLLQKSLELCTKQCQQEHEYLLQCVLSALYTQACSEKAIRPQRHNIALLVKALRIVQTLQTQKLVLLLLNGAAQVYPEDVLYNITMIFTFMGNNLLNQDDNYSFQVVFQTIDTVIPALLQTCVEGGDMLSRVCRVTRVFVDAFDHIPEHRQKPVFEKLLATLGPSQYLWAVVAQMADVASATANSALNLKEELPAILDFALSMCSCFDLETNVETASQLIKFASLLPATTQTNWNRGGMFCDEIFDIGQRDETHLNVYRFNIANFVNSLFTSTNFLAKVAEFDQRFAISGEVRNRLITLYDSCLSSTLVLVHSATQWIQRKLLPPFLKTWKLLVVRLHDVVDKVVGLLPGEQFIGVMKNLLKESLPSIRRKAMELLNTKLIVEEYFTEDDNDSLLALVRPMCRGALGKWKFEEEELSHLSEIEVDEALLVNRQTALLTLKLLCKRLGADYPDKFENVFGVVIKLLSQHETLHPAMTSSALLCFAQLVHVLPTESLSHLSAVMEHFVSIIEQREKSELIILGLVSTLNRLVKDLPAFLSPYLVVFITQTCLLAAKTLPLPERGLGARAKAAALTPAQQRFADLLGLYGKNIAPRVLMPVIEDAIKRISSVQAVGHLMTVFRGVLQNIDKDDIPTYSPQLQSLVVELLDFRQRNVDKLSMEDVLTAEQHILDTVKVLAFKLSEVTFRPFFTRVYNWATTKEAAYPYRVVTFYHLCYRLAAVFKSLFVLFASLFVTHAAQVLDRCHISKPGNDTLYSSEDPKGLEHMCLLAEYILSTLDACFQHGGQSFATRDNVNIVSAAILGQLSNYKLGDEARVRARIHDCLEPCIAHMMAASEDSVRKELHQGCLLPTRHRSPLVRLGTLQCFRALVQALGDEYVVHLPEAVPFLAELMEDDCTEVEQLCQELVVEMEKLLGEPIMKYF